MNDTVNFGRVFDGDWDLSGTCFYESSNLVVKALGEMNKEQLMAEGAEMDEKPKGKWYFKTSVVIIAFLCVGPLALPLVLFNPRFSQRAKLVITIIVIILSYYLAVSLISALRIVNQYYRLVF